MARLWKTLLGGTALVAATTIVTSVVSQEKKQTLGDMPPEAQKAMACMEAWMKYGTPGPEHKKMQESVGLWHNTGTFWMYPGAEPETSESVTEIKPILGGRFLVEEMSGIHEWEGQKQVMQGFGLFGFDNYAKKHFFVWADSMSTVPMYGEGEGNAQGEITYLSKMPDPTTPGKVMEFKSVMKQTNPNQHTFTMFGKDDKGQWWKHFELNATRQP